MLNRNVTDRLRAALADTPVVLIHGARQTGKSTLARWLSDEYLNAQYVTLDDATTLAAALDDPSGFLTNLGRPLVLDEVQRVPELFLALKAAVGKDRVPGGFLLTGSANVLLVPRLSESLVGRMEIIDLWPFSQGELAQHVEGFVEQAFSDDPSFGVSSSETYATLTRRVLAGGYPEAVARDDPDRRSAWFRAYVATIVQRDVRDLANIEYLAQAPRLLSLLAARSGSLLNMAEISRSSGIKQTTLKRYLALLETVFLLQRIPAWSPNLGKRLVKSPKVILTDSGLIAELRGLNAERLFKDRDAFGSILESFVIMEIVKQRTWSRTRARVYHFRSSGGYEVDLVLETPSGGIVGIEVKASATVRGNDFRGLQYLSELVGHRFHRGYVLYTGARAVPFGDRLSAVPVSAVWMTRRGGSD